MEQDTKDLKVRFIEQGSAWVIKYSRSLIFVESAPHELPTDRVAWASHHFE